MRARLEGEPTEAHPRRAPVRAWHLEVRSHPCHVVKIMGYVDSAKVQALADGLERYLRWRHWIRNEFSLHLEMILRLLYIHVSDMV